MGLFYKAMNLSIATIFCIMTSVMCNPLPSVDTNSTIAVTLFDNHNETVMPDLSDNPKVRSNEPQLKSALSDTKEPTAIVLNIRDDKANEEHPRTGELVAVQRQYNVFPNIIELTPSMEVIRKFIKTAYKTYLLLVPETKMGQCMVKHLYIQYPNVMRKFRVENLEILARRLYERAYKVIYNIVNNIFSNWFEDEESNQKSAPPQHVYLLHHHPIIYNRRFVREVTNSKSNEEHRNLVNQSTSERKRPVQNATELEAMDADASIDLSKKTLEREADELFDIDTMFWRSVGIERNSMKKYSLAYCSRQYVTSVFNRFIKNVLLS